VLLPPLGELPGAAPAADVLVGEASATLAAVLAAGVLTASLRVDVPSIGILAKRC